MSSHLHKKYKTSDSFQIDYGTMVESLEGSSTCIITNRFLIGKSNHIVNSRKNYIGIW